MSKKTLVLLSALIVTAGIVAAIVFPGSEVNAQASAMTELNVSNLSCGSCVSNVKDALSRLDGIGQVDVSVTSGRGQVTYDPRLVSAEQIAQTVTDAGYPASVRLDLNADEYKKLQAENVQMSATYVARIGKRLLARADFDKQVLLRSGGHLAGSPSPYANQQLRAQVWQEMLEREILLAAAEKNQVVVQDGEVELEAKRIKAATRDFDAAVKTRFGGYDDFLARLKENMVINRNIEQNVVAGLTTDREKQLRFSQWYDETQQNTDVTIFDPALQQAAAAGSSSCGGSCGG